MKPHRDATSQRRCRCPRAGGSSSDRAFDRGLPVSSLSPWATELLGVARASHSAGGQHLTVHRGRLVEHLLFQPRSTRVQQAHADEEQEVLEDLRERRALVRDVA